MDLTTLAMSYKFTKQTTGGRGGSGIIDVTELPTENIDENAVYRIKGYSEIDVLVSLSAGQANSFTTMLQSQNPNATVNHFVVDSLPANPQTTDCATFSIANIYIKNDIPYVYGNAGAGNMWLDLATVLTGMGLPFENKGFTTSPICCVEGGVYVTYKKDITAIKNSPLYKYSNGTWVDYYNMYLELCGGVETDTFIVPEGLSKIRSRLFHSCTKLKNIIFSHGLEVIGVESFYHSGLTGTLTLPTGLKRIESCAFYQNDKLEEVFIPDTVVSLGQSTFAQCATLKKVVFDEHSQFEGSNDNDTLFFDCSALESIDLPNSVTYLSQGMFTRCRNLVRINYGGTKAQWKAIEKANSENYQSAWDDSTGDYTIYCTDGTIAKDGTET